MIVALTGRASFAFTITPDQPGANYFRAESPYFLSGNQGSTVLDPRFFLDPDPSNYDAGTVTPLSLGGTLRFTQVGLRLWSLPRLLEGWSFKPAQNNLKGSFEIVTNEACGFQDGCGGDGTNLDPRPETSRGVGSLFYLKYHPIEDDPRPGQGKLHWIQMVQANYAIPVGFPSIFIDTPGGNTETPFYGTGTPFADEDFFIDRPYAVGRSAALRDNYFNAQLYLAEVKDPVNKPREVTIYNGVRWGWKNNAPRIASTPIAPSCYGGSGGGGCFATRSFGISDNESVGQELPLSDIDSGEASQSPKSVPEPTTVLGLLALGAWGVVQGLKKRIAKQP